ncbi:dihydropteroate synthase [Candidatus Fermentibacterales bacterium]|nr:dihydropteroate synthase [Candidatus Fermentibacterales bacterium]
MTPGLRRLHLSCQRDWLRELELIGADTDCWDRVRERSGILVFRVDPIRAPAASILKQSMLASGCDAIISRDTITCRCEETGALVMGTPRNLRLACLSLEHQPFGLPEIGRRISSALDSPPARPESLEWDDRRIDFSGLPAVIGVLNVTPDSFSDGGIYLDPDAAVSHALSMISEGASVIDVGAESTRPGALPVPEGVQIDRVIPVIREIVRSDPGALVSIDTSSAKVAAAALDAGACMINDVRALADAGLRELAARAGVPVVLMHMKGTPADMQVDPAYEDCVGEIYAFLAGAVARAVEAGVRRELIIVDPGIGFGKRLGDNLEILRRLSELRWLGLPVLLGHSRKSFIAHLLGDVPAEQRDAYTHIVTAMVAHDADMLRVHDVAGTLSAIRLGASLKGG